MIIQPEKKDNPAKLIFTLILNFGGWSIIQKNNLKIPWNKKQFHYFFKNYVDQSF